MNPSPDPPAPRRLDHAVAAAAGVSRRHAQRLLASGQVRVNGEAATAGDKGRTVKATDHVMVSDDYDQVLPEPGAALCVLAAGEGWVAVDKPSGVPVHPLRAEEGGTLLNAVAARYPGIQGVGEARGEGGLRSGVVHRLDTDTSGIVLFALDADHWQRFRDAFSAHRVEKRYLALVHGSPPPTRRIDVYLAVTRHRPALVEVVRPGHPVARRCTLSFTVRHQFRDAALVEVRLETGFLHQVRVSLAHQGHPLLGDPQYGEPERDPVPCGRTMLHAASLKLDEVSAEAPLPNDLCRAIETLRQ